LTLFTDAAQLHTLARPASVSCRRVSLWPFQTLVSPRAKYSQGLRLTRHSSGLPSAAAYF
ncbi:hypothetical protein, partial [Sphaerotilus mobilis]|uniref:hypothetical protein n=1 Tax=Sphaerotilus mobilis TaxID=47994 RepID=UPI001A92E85C